MSALYTVDHHQTTLQRHKPLSVFVSLVVLLCTTANFSHCSSAVGRRVSLVPRPLGQSANSADHGSEGAVWRSRNNATLRQLYRAIIRENAIRQPGGDYDAWKDNRKKRPTSKSCKSRLRLTLFVAISLFLTLILPRQGRAPPWSSW